MKRFLAFISAFVMAFSLCAFVGCNLADVGKIEWIREPAKVYTLNGTETLSFSIKITEPNGGATKFIEYPSENANDIKVEGFDTTSKGTKTAKVKFGDKLELSFTYDVVETGFAGGTGSEINPYIINNADHFQKMLQQKAFYYYKLGASIDFSGKALNRANKGTNATSEEAWVGEIDGDGRTLSNISQVNDVDGSAINKYNELFGRVASETNGKFVLKNVTVKFASEGTGATMGLVNSNGVNGVVVFENVKVEGNLNAADSGNSHLAPFMTFPQRKLPNGNTPAIKSVTFKDCQSNVKIFNSYAKPIVSAFITGDNTIPSGAIKFENCSFNGRIEGAKDQTPGAFFAIRSQLAEIMPVEMKNCTMGADASIVVNKTSCNNCEHVSDYRYMLCNGNIHQTANIGVNITGNFASEKITKIDSMEIAVNGTKVSCTVDGADSYAVFVSFGMVDLFGKGGQICFEQKVNGSEVQNGTLTKTLLCYKADLETAPQGEIIVNNNNVLTYYGKNVCSEITFSSGTVTVVAFKDGKAVAVAQKGGLNLLAQ